MTTEYPDPAAAAGAYPDPLLIRTTLDWGQQRLADEVGVARETISRWENGAAAVSPMGRRALARVWREYGGSGGGVTV